MTQPRELTFETPRRIICYEWGDAKAPRTVFCMHGLTRNGRDFDALAQSLASSGYRVLCPDMPGRGKSPWLATPEGYNNGTYATDALFILDALKIEKVDWIGTSMGGLVAMIIAASAPQRLRSLVLNDVGAVVSGAGLERIFTYAGVVMTFADRAQAEATIRRVWAPFGITREDHWQHMFAHSLVESAGGGFALAYDPAIMAGLPKPDGPVADMDVWPLFNAVLPIPTLLIRGAQSDLLSHETALAMQAAHPRLTLHEVPDAGHAPALMEAQDIALIRDWLGAQEPKKSVEIGGRGGLEPTRYGDWESAGRCVDF